MTRMSLCHRAWNALCAPCKKRQTLFLLVITGPFLYLLSATPVYGGSFNAWGIDGKYSLKASYAISKRLEDPSNRNINAPGRPEVPIAEFLKFPESNNHDDGNRNFEKGAIVNNRLTLLGDFELRWRDYGILVRGDAFYDDAYTDSNDHDAENRINTSQQPFNTFTDEAEEFSAKRARLLDAYAYGSWFFGDTMALQVRAGRHIAAWGQSLFFGGVALAMATADATKATVPGADVKSILLPENQVSMTFAVTERLTLLGQYQFEHKPVELNPVGEFYSVADIVGPGAEMAFGIKNPLFLDTLSGVDLTSPSDITELLDTIGLVFNNQFDVAFDPIIALLNNPLLNPIIDLLPTVNLPTEGLNPFNAPEGLNPIRLDDILPEDEDQYGYGLEYAITDTTQIGLYRLKYHSTTPAPQFNFGPALLIPAQDLLGLVPIPDITTELLGLNVPVSYNVRYFDDITLNAIGLSTILFGVNIGAEVVEKKGIDVLVDVDNGIAGPVPTPTRARSRQYMLNGIYTMGPKFFWDSLTLVAELGYIEVDKIEPQQSVFGPRLGEDFNNLTFDDSASAFALLGFFNTLNVFPGWDLTIPISVQGAVKGRSAVNGAFGSLFGEDDYRVGVGIEMTRLSNLAIGINYNVFTGGEADFLDRPLQDRDTIGLTVKYNIF